MITAEQFPSIEEIVVYDPASKGQDFEFMKRLDALNPSSARSFSERLHNEVLMSKIEGAPLGNFREHLEDNYFSRHGYIITLKEFLYNSRFGHFTRNEKAGSVLFLGGTFLYEYLEKSVSRKLLDWIGEVNNAIPLHFSRHRYS